MWYDGCVFDVILKIIYYFNVYIIRSSSLVHMYTYNVQITTLPSTPLELIFVTCPSPSSNALIVEIVF